MAKATKKNCIDCGKEFDTYVGSRRVRCDECRASHIRAYRRVYERERYQAEKEMREQELRDNPDLIKYTKGKGKVWRDPNVCTKKSKCYYGETAGNMWLCNYLEITGVKRPCSPVDCYMFKRKED